MDNKELYDIICAVHNGNMSQMRAIELIRTHIERLEAENANLLVDGAVKGTIINSLQTELATYKAVVEKADMIDWQGVWDIIHLFALGKDAIKEKRDELTKLLNQITILQQALQAAKEEDE